MPSALATAAKIAEPILHSPCLIETVEYLQQRLAEEAARRERFYDDMTPSEKMEFIEGEVVVHSPARRAHLNVRKFVERLLDNYVDLNGLGEVHSEKCLCVFPRNDYEPDIVYFSSAKMRSFDDAIVKFPIPDLVVEVLSYSTEHRDRGIKFEDFEAHGVTEYWIIDPEEQVIEQYVRQGEHFERVEVSEILESRAVEGFRVPQAALFDGEVNQREVDRIRAERRQVR